MSQPDAARGRWVVALAVLTGIALRFYGLGVHSLWLDEGCTLFIAGADSIPEALRRDAFPPLSYYPFALLLGLEPSDAMLRVVPATASSIALLLFARLTSTFCSSTAERVAATLLYALAPFLVWYAHEVRMYAWMELFGVLTLTALAQLRAGTRGAAVTAAAAAALGFGTHYYGCFTPLAGVVVALWWRSRDQVSRGPALRFVAASLAGLLVWCWWLLDVLPDQLAAGWTAIGQFEARDFASLPVRLLFVQLSELPLALVYSAATLIGLACGAAFVASLRARRERGATTWRQGTLLVMAAAPIVGALAASWIVQPRFVSRYFIAAAAPFVLLLARSVFATTSVRVAVLWTALLAGCCCWANVHLHSTNLKGGARAVGALVAASFEPGDEIAVCTMLPDGFSESMVRFYVEGELGDVPITNVQTTDELDAVREQARGRVHFVARWMAYSAPRIQELLAHAPVIERGPETHDLQWYLLPAQD